MIESIWKEFHEELLGFVRKRVRDQGLAEEILQDVFVKVLEKQDSLKDAGKLRPWLYAITRNTISDHYRKQGPTNELGDMPASENEGEVMESFAGCVRPFVSQLPEKYRQAVIMADFEHLPQTEIARRLGISHSGAKSRVQRGRAMLRESLLACCRIQTDVYGSIVEFEKRIESREPR